MANITTRLKNKRLKESATCKTKQLMLLTYKNLVNQYAKDQPCRRQEQQGL